MNKDWRERITERMEKLGWKPTPLSLKAGLGRSGLHDILHNRSNAPRIDTLQKLGNVLGMSLAEILEGQSRPPVRVPIIGELTDGDEWRPFPNNKKNPETFDLPTLEEDLVSVKVLGNSMAPRYQKGDVLVGSRTFGNNADNYIGLPVIVKTEDDRTYVKVLTRGVRDNTYTLRSYDPGVQDVADVTLRWFAPIVAILPQGA